MKYRKKPIIVEAVQFLVLEGGPHRMHPPPGVDYDVVGMRTEESIGDLAFFVVTIQGVKTPIKHGEWVITETDGIHHYPCANDIYAATYELVE